MQSDEDAYLAMVEDAMRATLARAERMTRGLFGPDDLALYDVLRYHLGWADERLQPASFASGKRTRPLVCLLVCAAAGGDPARAVPIAAGIELLHNFTLIHDDIQDVSETRRHRPTVWRLWGVGQAINAGDGLFALSQLALLGAGRVGLPAERVLELAAGFSDVTLRIVEGQVLDLGFEERWDIGGDDYLAMIAGKTAAIVAFSAWAGAVAAGASAQSADRWRDFGEALGLGFQMQDDLLGIWGAAAETGKPVADDIRRHKKSFPIVTLAAEAGPADLDALRAAYAAPAGDECAVRRVLELLDRYGVRQRTEETVARYHDQARDLLLAAAAPSAPRATLEALLERLARRVS